MRSRYSAYVFEKEQYLLETWHPKTRPQFIPFDVETKWLGLTIEATERGGPLDMQGAVEFVASFETDGDPHSIHELSQFERVDGKWIYVDGTVKRR
jgi:SEC-C motif domain protein